MSKFKIPSRELFANGKVEKCLKSTKLFAFLLFYFFVFFRASLSPISIPLRKLFKLLSFFQRILRKLRLVRFFFVIQSIATSAMPAQESKKKVGKASLVICVKGEALTT